MSAANHRFLPDELSQDFTGCYSHCFVKDVGWRYICHPGWKGMEISQIKVPDIKFDFCMVWVAESFQANVEYYHQHVMIAFDICY